MNQYRIKPMARGLCLLNRRELFALGLGASLGLVSKTSAGGHTAARVGRSLDFQRTTPEEIACRYEHLLGRPSSAQSVRDFFHPIPPERVVELRRAGCSEDTHCGKPTAHIQHWIEPVQREPEPSVDIGLIVRIIDVLTEFYDIPECLKSSVKPMVSSEDFVPSISHRGVALVRPFQRSGIIPTRNSPVDWWLFFLSEGCVDWNDEADELHSMLVQVASDPVASSQSFDGLFLAHLIYRIHARPAKWREATRMSRADAARFVNRQILLALRGVPGQGRF